MRGGRILQRWIAATLLGGAAHGSESLDPECSRLMSDWHVTVEVVQSDITLGIHDSNPTIGIDQALALRETPSESNVRTALALLDEAQHSRKAVNPYVISVIVAAIGEHHLEEGRKYVLRFLWMDPSKPGARSLSGAAARSLGMLGGEEALRELISFANQSGERCGECAAIALGRFDDGRAIEALEKLARSSDPKVSYAALATLMWHCRASSRSVALESLGDSDPLVKFGGVAWVASCGIVEDEPRLAVSLREIDARIRQVALRGLIRLHSKEACGQVEPLLRDEDAEVRALARCYRNGC